MKGNRKVDSRAEIAVRSAVHAAGLRFRKNYRVKTRDRSVVVDIVFPVERLVVLVDGCFWHVCPEHGVRPRTNHDYWGPKLRRNVERDREVDAALVDSGWRVLRFWEHEDPAEVASAVERAVRETRSHGSSGFGR